MRGLVDDYTFLPDDIEVTIDDQGSLESRVENDEIISVSATEDDEIYVVLEEPDSDVDVNVDDDNGVEVEIEWTGGGVGGNLPSGGNTGDVLAKRSDNDFDVEWTPIHSDDFGTDLDYDTDNSMLYLVNMDGERIGDGVQITGGGGGGGNNAVVTITNTTGWLTKTINFGESCVLSFTWSSIEQEMPTGDGIMTVTVGGIAKKIQDVAQGPVSVDVGPYMASGSNKVKVSVSDVYGNTKSINFTITAVVLTITSTFDTSGIFNANEPVTYTYTPNGNVEKAVHFVVDDVQVGVQYVYVSGRQQSYQLPGMLHGAHSLLVYFTATIDGETVSSNSLYYELVVVDGESPIPIISSTYLNSVAVQYETIVIPYRVYTPNSLTSEVSLYNGDTLVAQLTVDRTEQLWSYRFYDVGPTSLSITSGVAVRTFYIDVTDSPIDIQPVTQDLSLYLTSAGRSNSELNPAIWEDEDNHISCTMTGFNFVSDGWILDNDGITVLRVSGDARVVIPYQAFATDFRGTGKTIEVEFATRNVLNYDSTVISCESEGRGFTLTAQKATLTSEQSEIYTQYKEDEHVRISFVVDKRNEDRLVLIYINGIMSGVLQYPLDDDFSQSTPVNITIGSNDCTTDVYNIRIYDNNLTRYQILENWIADTQSIDLMLDRYNHNHVYNEYGDVVIDMLPADLPYMVLSCPELPQYKGDKKTISGYYVDQSNQEQSFSFVDAQADVQGTSSQYYPRKNYKIKFNGGFVMTSTGEVMSKYKMRPTSIPTKTFTFKADVASSEGANNVELVRLYNDTCVYRTPPQIQNQRIRQGIDGFPIVMFWDDGNTIRFVGKYNFNNDKGTEEVYGFAEGDESWEILNNTSSRVIWKNDDFTGNDWLNDFEGRYPDGNEVPTNLAALSSWLVSTDQSAATGNALPTPYVDVDGITHTVDNAAYRLAKFKTELEDHMEKDSAIYYYLFTELFLMVDSRAKNAFPSFFGSDKWCWLPYDMDTSIGINNEGTLTFGYSLEDTDTLPGGADVYNGQDSVMWVNLRQAFFEDIKSMYQTLRSTGAISYSVVERAFEDHQSKWPEAIFNEDSWFKYIDPLTEDGTASYLSMAQGSKEEQRKWWLYNRFRYIDSKYNAGDALNDLIQVRGYAKADVTITPYADIYPTIKYGSYLVSERGQRNVPTTLTNPLTTVNDTEIYIYSASQLASVGDLSGLKVGFADFSMATKLQSIKVGDSAAGYTNPNLEELYVGNNRLLNTVDARNCTALTQAVDLSGAVNVEYVYFDGTLIPSCALPNGGILKELHLPATVTNLTVRNQPAMETFVMPDYSNITTLRVENTPNIPVLDILDDMAPNSRVRIIGFTLTVSSTDDVEDFYDYLDTMRGLDEQGGNVDHAVVSGTITGLGSITGDWLAQMQARYPDIVIEYEHITSNLYYYTWDGETLLYSETITDGGNGTYAGTPQRAGTEQYSYTFIGWARYTDQNVADPYATVAVTADRSIYAAYAVTVRTYTVYFRNGTTTLQTVRDVPYGGTAVYTGETPVHPTSPEEYRFIGWDPTGENITSNTYCYATYLYIGVVTRKIITRTLSQTLLKSDITRVGTYAFASCASLSDITMTACTTIESHAFEYCTRLSNPSFANCTTIGDYAFYSCASLRTVSFPSCETIGDYAFASIASLSEINLPRCVSVGVAAFYSASRSLSSVYMPMCRTIGSSAFRNCNSLETVSFPECVSIGGSTFANLSKLSSISFPNCETVEYQAFGSCTALTELQFPKCVTIFGSAFNGCSSVTIISFPACKTIYGYAFAGVNFRSAYFPECTKLSMYALTSCYSVSVISIPSCASIERYAFDHCYNLVSLYLMGSSVAVLTNSDAFRSTPIGGYSASAGRYGSIYVPLSLLNAYQISTNWTFFASRFVGVEGGE